MTKARVWAFLWIALAVLLVLVTLGYAAAAIYSGKSSLPALELIGVVLLILLLFVVEGAEVAAVALLDKDPDQIAEQRIRETVLRIQAHREAFLAGRQIVEISLIVILTFLSASLFRAGEIGMPSQIGAVLSPETTTFLLGFGLSSLIVFWFAQLLAKLIAEERPLDVLDWLPTRILVRVALGLDAFQLGAPGVQAWNRLKTRLRPYAKELLPSRDMLYRLSAQLRHGRGVESNEIEIVIGIGGEVAVTSRRSFQAFGKGFDGVVDEHRWEAKIDPSSCHVDITTEPKGCGYYAIQGPTITNATFDGRVVPDGKITWDLRFQGDIPIGERLETCVRFSTAVGACKTTAGSKDFYAYTVYFPTRLVQIAVRPTDNAHFILRDAECEVKMSDDPEVNHSERERVVNINYEKGGFVFQLRHPCEGTVFNFSWRVAQRNPNRTVAPGAAQASPNQPIKGQ